MVYDIFNFLTGYVYIKIEGTRLERALNSGITFWNVSRSGYSCMYANVSLMAYRRLLKYQGLHITLIREMGIFSLFKRLWANKALFFGLCVCTAALAVISSMVVGIEVSGYYSLKKEDVEAYVNEWGVKPFSFKRSIDLDGLCNYLRSKDNIAWASAGYNGVILNVVIIEQVNEYDNTPCDIVSSRQAVIKKIDVYAGIKNKQIGDSVSEGEMLVTGIRQIGDSIERIKARATVVGTVWETGSYTMEAAGLTIKGTGNTIQERYIDFWGNKSYIEKKENPFEHYVVTKEEKPIGGFRSVLPVKYVTLTYNEVAISYEDKDINAVTQQVGTMAFQAAAAKAPENAKIVATDIKYEMNEGHITANAILELDINIGIDVPVN